MKTPITDSAANDSIVKVYETSKRLETDRASLMEALEDLVSAGGNYCDLLNAADKSRRILAAAKANFPQP